MSKELLIIIIGICRLMQVSSYLDTIICDQRNEFSGDIICNVPLYTNICLVCPVRRRQTDSSWQLPDGSVLFREEVKVDRGDVLAVNVCGTSNYTLLLTSMQKENKYVCKLHNRTVAKFKVHVEGLCESTSSDLTYCQVRHHAAVCLVCPVSSNITGIKWEYNGIKTLFRGAVKTDVLPNKLTVNNCSLNNYTLSIKNLTEEAGGQYSCYHFENKIAEFIVQTKDMATVKILLNGQSKKYLKFKEGMDVKLTCIANNFDLPLTLSWEINGNEIYREPITYSSTPEIRRDLFFKVSKTNQTIFCISRSLSLSKLASVLLSSDNSREKKFATSFLFITIVSIGTLACLTVFIPVFIFRTKGEHSGAGTSFCSRNILLSKRISHNSDKDDYFQVEATDESPTYVRLETSLQSNGYLVRWVGEIVCESYAREACVVNVCKENSTSEQRDHFKALAILMRDKLRHKNIIEIFGVEVDRWPSFFYTEFVKGGSLKNYLITQKHDSGFKVSNQRDLTRMTQETVSALAYLKSYHILHPGISCRKVLMTENKVCKIYDFCAYPVAEYVIDKILHENSSSVKLSLAPETRTSKEYTFESDVFSVATFIWEVYALGLDSADGVYAAISESSGNDHEYLPRPDICPSNTYVLLRSCWASCKAQRPPIETIEQHLAQALEITQ